MKIECTCPNGPKDGKHVPACHEKISTTIDGFVLCVEGMVLPGKLRLTHTPVMSSAEDTVWWAWVDRKNVWICGEAIKEVIERGMVERGNVLSGYTLKFESNLKLPVAD